MRTLISLFFLLLWGGENWPSFSYEIHYITFAASRSKMESSVTATPSQSLNEASCILKWKINNWKASEDCHRVREVPYLKTSVRLNKGSRKKVEEEEKVSLLMILKRPVGESHHISIVKEPHLRKIHKSWKTQRLENCIRISINSKSISDRNYYYCGVGADGLLFNSTRRLWFLYLSQACEKTKTEHISHLKYNI